MTGKELALVFAGATFVAVGAAAATQIALSERNAAPVVADTSALEARLEQMERDQVRTTKALERLSGTGVEIDLFVDLRSADAVADPSSAITAAGRYEPLLEDTVYRLVQESLNNAIRHGHAVRAIVEVIEEEGEIRIRVTDDGSGFDPSQAAGGFGLLGMRERVNLTGGHFDVRSGEEGTTITAALPARRS